MTTATREACSDVRAYQATRNHAVIIPRSSLHIWHKGLTDALRYAAIGRNDLAISSAIAVRNMIGREIEP